MDCCGFHFKSIGVNTHAHKKEPPPNPRISHTHEIVYEYGSNPAEILGFQNPRLSAGFKNCL
jgi:hypothetical protein